MFFVTAIFTLLLAFLFCLFYVHFKHYIGIQIPVSWDLVTEQYLRLKYFQEGSALNMDFYDFSFFFFLHFCIQVVLFKGSLIAAFFCIADFFVVYI